jgi:hypothetical protein
VPIAAQVTAHPDRPHFAHAPDYTTGAKAHSFSALAFGFD